MRFPIRFAALPCAGALWLASLTVTSAAPDVAKTAPITAAQAKLSAEDLEKGKELAERVCTACHELGPDVTAGRSADAWRKVVEEMRVMGAQASDEEAALITAYLIQTYPAK
jgi:hypothetical protein